ncbi:MAG TPA: biotin/lipoyl-containing protein [Candidatus Limnocylindrales bacterium]|nr:biotin/lipoyl-containing protein [Candidatus Limnocylindrales bacterium]
MTDDPGRPLEAEATTEPVGVPIEPEQAAVEAPAPTPADVGNVSLLALIDRLGGLLERSDLTELEVEAGGTSLVLRKPEAIAQLVAAGAPGGATGGGAAGNPAARSGTAEAGPTDGRAAGGATAAPARPSVKAPLTGIWYGSPAPGSAPFVEVGREVAVGQVIGLIEAMKLFNEIKSDLAGRVVRVVPESGALVKAKQPLIEVEPL